MLRLLSLSSLLLAGCVTTGTHRSKIAELEKLRADDQSAAKAQQAKLEAEVARLNQAIAALERDMGKEKSDLARQLQDLTTERDGLRKKLNDTSALADTLKARLEKLGQNVDKLTSEKGQLAETLADAKVRLEELRKQKAAAEARAATFRELMTRLRSMIDAGQLKVVIRDGRMLIALPNDVLFDSGKTNVKPEGQAALVKVAQVLAGISDRHFLVAGHTDNVPIRSSRFASNWELSTQRAVEVTKLLIQNGMKPDVLAAAGYGEFDPVIANDSNEHKSQNRRIEIVLQPNLSDLPSLDGVQSQK